MFVWEVCTFATYLAIEWAMITLKIFNDNMLSLPWLGRVELVNRAGCAA